MQYTRTFALPYLLFELFHLFSFLVLDIAPIMLMGIQNAYNGRGHSVEVQCPCTITLSCFIFAIIPLLHLKSICHIYESRTIQGIQFK